MSETVDRSLPVDVIRIDKIVARGKHGVTAAEREQELPLELSVELLVDLSRAAQTDNIDDTINYSTLNQAIVSVVQTRSRHLIEKLAEDVLEVIFQDQRVRQATVRIAKPERLNGATPSVTLVRRNE
ncbi:MAG: dihydroneopterin aldolase [Cyanobacteria bacterium SZAS LIN-5]|jgi:7,8-dihydroneopterin aldolase/epimerase/oxygenase|nr:dihydroneopterin aldolase [Cyanobacteria bacterium SZAS LIN-5]RTL43172.1 MAG: dihydroneopterin aldolase [Candidatus Melainabacteria bacterium]